LIGLAAALDVQRHLAIQPSTLLIFPGYFKALRDDTIENKEGVRERYWRLLKVLIASFY
jgi:hypothetical protein